MTTRISVVGLGVAASLLAHAAALAYVMETTPPPPPPPLPQIELQPLPPAPPVASAPPAEAKPTPPQPAPPPEVKPVVKPKPVHPAAVHKAPPVAPPIRPLATTAASAEAVAPSAAPAVAPTSDKATATAEAASTAVEQPSGPPLDYIGSIRAQLEQSKRYPASARRAGREGTVSVRFAIDRQGRLLDSRIEQGSDVDALDQETLELVQRVAPYPPLPETYQRDRLVMVIPVRYALKER